VCLCGTRNKQRLVPPYSIKLVFIMQTVFSVRYEPRPLFPERSAYQAFPPHRCHQRFTIHIIVSCCSQCPEVFKKYLCPKCTVLQWPWHVVLQAGSYSWVWTDKFVRTMVQIDKSNCAINWGNVMTFNVMLSCSRNGMNTLLYIYRCYISSIIYRALSSQTTRYTAVHYVPRSKHSISNTKSSRSV
jgi:hypothetical protein